MQKKTMAQISQKVMVGDSCEQEVNKFSLGVKKFALEVRILNWQNVSENKKEKRH